MTDIVDRLRDGGVFPMTFGGPDVKDVAILYDPMTPTDAIKEIERLRAQIKFGSCTTRITNNGIDVGHCTLKPEVERLRSDNERLRAALWDAIDAYTWWCEDQYDRDQSVVGDAIFEARAALKANDD